VAQVASVTIVHAPDAAQQAPVGATQFALAHTDPVPRNVPGHMSELVTAQVPSG